MDEQINSSKSQSGDSDSVQHALTHADHVAKNARSSWFGLLGFLAFAGVTLLGFEDKDFFASGVETDLPLIGVSIPTYSFFWVAPILATALYIHLHMYLIKLWRAVYKLPSQIDGEPLGARLWPWLVTDWALAGRGDQGKPLPLPTIQWMLTLVLVWLSGPIVLFGFWWRSMVRHDWLLTTALGMLLVLASYVGGAGWRVARKRQPHGTETDANQKRRFRGVVEWIRRAGVVQWILIRFARVPLRVFKAANFALLSLPVLWISVERTRSGPLLPRRLSTELISHQMAEPENISRWLNVVLAGKIPLAEAGLTNAQLSLKPADWLNRDIARLDFLKQFRERQGLPAGRELEGKEKESFEDEWRILGAR